jgi:hypothetical protein
MLAIFAYFVFTRPPLPKEQLEPRKRTEQDLQGLRGHHRRLPGLSPLLDWVLSDDARPNTPAVLVGVGAVWAFSFSWMVQVT